MVYSDVVARGLILPRKEKYTRADVDAVMVGSLFSGQRQTFSEREAAFIVKSSAIFHDTEYSETVAQIGAGQGESSSPARQRRSPSCPGM